MKRRRAESRYAGKVCFIEKSNSGLPKILDIGVRTIRKDEYVTRFSIIEEELKNFDWQLYQYISLYFPSLQLSASARLCIPAWLKTRGIDVVAESDGRLLVIRGT